MAGQKSNDTEVATLAANDTLALMHFSEAKNLLSLPDSIGKRKTGRFKIYRWGFQVLAGKAYKSEAE